MLNEHPAAAVAPYAEQFTDPSAQLAAASIAAGNTSGRLWLSDAGAAGPLVLWDQGNNVLYLAGVTPGSAGELGRLINTEIRAAALAAGLARFSSRALDAVSADAIAALLGPLISGERRVQFWEWPGGEPSVAAATLAGLQLSPIDERLLSRRDIDGLDEVRDEIGWMWPSAQRFVECGLGIVALLGRRVICWCTAEYVGPDRCGIGIATASDSRGRGVATATAAEFVRRATARGLTPCWECGVDNPASGRVAARVGFALRGEHRTWRAHFPA